MSVYPTTTEAFLEVAAVAVFAGAVTQWLKRYLPDWKLTPVVALVVAECTAIVAGSIRAGGLMLWSEGFESIMTGFWGATLATFGYEAIANILAWIGVAQRMADKALDVAEELRGIVEDSSYPTERAMRDQERVLMATGWIRDVPRRR